MPDIERTTTASQLSERLLRGETTAEAIATHYVAQTSRVGDDSVYISFAPEKLIEAARESDQRRSGDTPRSSWDGIPVAWKDLFDIRGTVTTAGSAVYSKAPPATADARVAELAGDAGLLPTGKTNLSEFAYSGLGLNPHFGTPVNPHSDAKPRAPGGSSSGSAVAVAAGLAPVAIGTDTAGSVRVPAAFCGIFGYKSTQARYSDAGVFPLSTSLDSIGTFAHCVDDLIVMDEILRFGRVTPSRGPATERSIFIPEDVVFDDVDEEIVACFDDFASSLTDAGWRVERGAFPAFSEVSGLFAKHGTLTVAEAATFHRHLLESDDAALMDQRVRSRMNSAAQFSAQDYLASQWARSRLEEAVRATLGTRFLLFPTVAITAPSIAELEEDDDHFVAVNLKALRNTMLGNFLGMPGVSMPIGTDRSGLPVGALLSASKGRDDAVLAAAREIAGILELKSLPLP